MKNTSSNYIESRNEKNKRTFSAVNVKHEINSNKNSSSENWILHLSPWHLEHLLLSVCPFLSQIYTYKTPSRKLSMQVTSKKALHRMFYNTGQLILGFYLFLFDTIDVEQVSVSLSLSIPSRKKNRGKFFYATNFFSLFFLLIFFCISFRGPKGYFQLN